jgi:uncharacterized OB-fold protein
MVLTNMVYCSNCGAPVADDANFCPKCGSKTPAGKAAKVAYPSDELKDIFYQVGNELEKAFTLAAKETHSALKKASENFQQRNAQPNQTASGATVTCSNCGAKNVSGAIFCYSCGKRIAESSGTA